MSDNFLLVNTDLKARKSAETRRDEIIEAAMKEFAYGGLHGTSTEAIARRAGISQPYLFRLFGTKKDLFIASCRRCFGRVLEAFQEAAEGKHGEEAMHSMGEAYARLLDAVSLRRGRFRSGHEGHPGLLRDGHAHERGGRHGPA